MGMIAVSGSGGLPRRLGIVGAGQLAQMTALAAAPLDVRVTVMSPDAADPAARGPATHMPGSPDSLDDLRRLAAATDVVTFDHEHVPHEHLLALEAEGVVLRPRAAAKLLAQDKARQREVLGGELGLPVPEHRLVRSTDEVERFAAEVGWPVVIKSRTGGYDGRGVWVAHDAVQAGEALAGALAAAPEALAECHVAIRRELAVLVVRSDAGELVTYPVVDTVQRDGMCREAFAPSPVDAATAEEAARLGRTIAEGIGATGVLAVELFLSDRGLLINELALRPHNSGHLTLGGCVTSQFENHVRAVLGLPLGAADLLAPASVMVNVVGPPGGSDPSARLDRALAVPGALVQLYGKAPRPGRKLGHVTTLGATVEEARERARRAAGLLEEEAA